MAYQTKNIDEHIRQLLDELQEKGYLENFSLRLGSKTAALVVTLEECLKLVASYYKETGRQPPIGLKTTVPCPGGGTVQCTFSLQFSAEKGFRVHTALFSPSWPPYNRMTQQFDRNVEVPDAKRVSKMFKNSKRRFKHP
ncbi:hypothetical protein [Chitinophaga defluvii]|uniref:Uncharacterized protein n=1 Tax=Chitinophaga defluvii TaxID=3163343 RepID=A0ABV2T8S0_9BACT